MPGLLHIRQKNQNVKIVPFTFVHAPPQEVVKAWDDGVGRLIQAGVNGNILLANLGAVKGLAVSATTHHPGIMCMHACVANRTYVWKSSVQKECP